MDLVAEGGTLTLDGRELPGEVQEVRVTGATLQDKVKVQGQSGTAKQPKGWEDQEVRVVLLLVDQEERRAVDRVRELHGFFAASDDAARPKVYRLVNEHAIARGIDKVIFARLETRDRPRDDVMQAELVFSEFRPIIVKKEKLAAKRQPTSPDWWGAGNPYLVPGEAEATVSEADWESAFDRVQPPIPNIFSRWAEGKQADSYGYAGESVDKFRGVFERPAAQPRTLTPQSPIVDDDNPYLEVERDEGRK